MLDSQSPVREAETPELGIQRFHASGDDLPPEVAALGPPQCVPLPWYMESIFHESNWPTFLWGSVGLGLALLLGPFALLVVQNPQNNAGYFLTSLAGCAVLLLPAFIRVQQKQPRPVKYFVYPDVFVLADKGEYTVIPWDAIQEWHAWDSSIVTADGQRSVLSEAVGNLSAIIGKIEASTSRRLLPTALEQLRSAGAYTSGPFTVSLTAIAYEGRTVRWDDIARFVFLLRTQAYEVRKHGELMPYRFGLRGVPNHWILMSVIGQACPPHLRQG
jgi:hypothetical protein